MSFRTEVISLGDGDDTENSESENEVEDRGTVSTPSIVGEIDAMSVRSSTSTSSAGSIPMAKKSSSMSKVKTCRMSTGTSSRIPASASQRLLEEIPVIEISDSDEEADNEEEDLIEISDDEEDDELYQDLTPEDMECFICGRLFKQRQQFIFHHRRHMAPEHFQCPTCLRGFTTLNLCFEHETKVHKKQTSVDGSPSVNGNPVPSSSNLNGGAHDSDSDVIEVVEELQDEDDENWLASDGTRVIPSNQLIGYRGPEVKHTLDCFSIEEKYGPRNRGVSPILKQMRLMQEALLNCRSRSGIIRMPENNQ